MDDGPWISYGWQEIKVFGPPKNTVWTVERAFRLRDIDVIAIIEWSHDTAPWGRQNEFRASHFVPLDGNEDISVFTAMLDKLPANHKQPVTVGGGL